MLPNNNTKAIQTQTKLIESYSNTNNNNNFNFVNSTNNYTNNNNKGSIACDAEKADSDDLYDLKMLVAKQRPCVDFRTVPPVNSNSCDVGQATTITTTVASYECANCKRVTPIKTPPSNIYENLPAFELNLSKEFLLEKYFRSDARTQAIYQNLCRGCGYGVFASQGDLCNFCECIVNGCIIGSEQQQPHQSSQNIYENICEHCGRLYSSAECVCQSETPLISDLDAKSPSVAKKHPKASNVKLGKSKSFGKRDKRSIFYGLFGTLRGGQSATKSSQPRTLEIVHHVDGHDNVFRTQETFDLQRICELKRSQTSCSDQHIYGRLKSTETLDSTATESETQNSRTLPTQLQQSSCVVLEQQQSKNGKRPRISKPRLLRVKSQNDRLEATPVGTPQPQSLYLNESLCHWLSSLRQQIHNYEIDQLTAHSSHPKSIPSKDIYSYSENRVLRSLAPTDLLTNRQQIDKSTTICLPAAVVLAKIDVTQNTAGNRASIISTGDSSEGRNSDDCLSPVTLRRNTIIEQQSDEEEEAEHAKQQVVYEQMILAFKQQLQAKQMQQQSKITNNSTTTMPATTTATTATQRANDLRSKRQAIYLKNIDIAEDHVNNNSTTESDLTAKRLQATESQIPITESNLLTEQPTLTVLPAATEQQNTEQNFNSKNNNNIANTTVANNLAQVSDRTTPDSPLVVSRRAIHQVITTVAAQQRYGINERNSNTTLVNDLLKAFDTILRVKDEEKRATEEEVKNSNDNASGDNEAGFEISVEGSAINQTNANVKALALIAGRDSSNNREGSPSCYSEVQQQTQTDADNTCYDSCYAQIVPQVTVFLEFETKEDRLKQFDLYELSKRQLLSFSLNRCVISYDKGLGLFLEFYKKKAPVTYQRQHRQGKLIRLYHKFQQYCVELAKKSGEVTKAIEFKCEETTKLSKTKTPTIVELKLINISPKCSEESANDVTKTFVSNEESAVNLQPTNSVKSECKEKRQERPKVPQRHPKTILSVKKSELNTAEEQLKPQRPVKRSIATKTEINESHLEKPTAKVTTKVMTVTSATHESQEKVTKSNLSNTKMANQSQTIKNTTTNADAESIYQPIWHYKTVGEVQERYETDADYFDPNAAVKSLHLYNEDDDHGVGGLSLNDDACYNIEDHGEWETDDEFMFTAATTTMAHRPGKSEHRIAAVIGGQLTEPNSSTMRSTHSNHSTSSSTASGSTVTGFGSSTATLASSIISVSMTLSLKHPVLRSIGIFYSISEPKLRAIVYDYERNHASCYFAKQQAELTTGGDGSSSSQNSSTQDLSGAQHGNDSGLGRSPVPPPRTTSNAAHRKQCSESTAATQPTKPTRPTKFALLPDSVLAWQFMLLDVHYLEDEEDMIVSESQILRAQEIKDDLDSRQTQQLNILQRFKSASIGNLIDLPNDDDKKSITERMRNKLQRGVFKLRSPKTDKKNRGIFRRAEATSLYLEDGMKPKYPIFGAPLDQLELNRTTRPNVPRFVVDCIEYIERADCIDQDGLYRASGNKVSIDELKQKLSESYIYDPKLLITDDIHTLTSLLKQFFRELGAPLIPQETYERLGQQLHDPATIEQMRIAFDEMYEPNRSTLKFVIKHLTNVAAHSSSNRMPASNLAIVWGPCLLSANRIEFDIGRMNTLAKVLIENYERIFASNDNERLVS